MIRYELRAGWNRPIEHFRADQEVELAVRWNAVYGNEEAACWKVDEDGARWGTVAPGIRRSCAPRLSYLERCAMCAKEFMTPRPNEPLCIACAICIRPAEAMPPFGTECPRSMTGFHDFPAWDPGANCLTCAARRPKT